MSRTRPRRRDGYADICGYSVRAVSKAGVSTAVHVRRGKRELNIAFDIGSCPESFFSAKHVFISHGHTDHVGAIFLHARGRSLTGQAPATYYVPVGCADALRRAHRCFLELDGKAESAPGAAALPVVEMAPGSSVGLGRGYTAEAFAVEHRVPAIGFLVSRTRKAGLKPEHRGKTREQLRALRDRGAEVASLETRDEIAYTERTQRRRTQWWR